MRRVSEPIPYIIFLFFVVVARVDVVDRCMLQ